METKVCCIKGCENDVHALGLCANHWRQNRKYGSPVAVKSHSGRFRGLPPEERFFMQVKKTESCWIWIGGRDLDGYGVFRGEVGGVTFHRAHRFSYAFHTGDLLIGMQALHRCDNPKCVNPDHLFAGTNADNMRDKAQKGRTRVPEGEKHKDAILTEEQAKAILADPRPYVQIAADYNVAPSTIGSLKQRVSWKKVQGEAVKAKRIGKRGESCYAAKITAEAVLAIRASGESGKELSARYGVSPQTITDIRKNRSWKHLLN